MTKKCICVLVSFCLLVSNVFASTNIYERTRDNLQVADSIKLTNSNISSILNTPKVDESEKIYDFAELLTSSEEELLYNEIKDFIYTTDLDMVIVTTDNNPKSSAMEYASDFYDYNYFGIGNTHDGLLFLMDMDTREISIVTTGEAQLVYDDYRIEKMLDVTYDKISQKEYYECALKFIEKSKDYFNEGIPSSNSGAYIDENGDYIYEESVRLTVSESLICAVIGSIVISIIALLIMASKHRTIKKATTAVSYMKDKSITIREDTFLTTHTDRVYSPQSRSSSSGGGSSTYRSSSGRSHGGGSRRF